MSCAIGWPFSIGETSWRAVRPRELKLRYALGKVIISTDEGEREVPLEKEAIISELKRGGELLMIHSKEPSLKEVFLRLTKKQEVE